MPCPATKFLMGLELSFQTRHEICFAMDLMASDLCKLMISRSLYCRQHSRRWTVQIALGINALHEIGIIHRDIKAENILIDVQENVRIGDFGLSHLAAEARPLDQQGAYSAWVAGTPNCMAPEILSNISKPESKKYGPPIDWWGLGCIVYQFFSHNHKTLFQTQDHILHYVAWCTGPDGRDKQLSLFKRFPAMLRDLISGLLDPRPSSRYGFREVSGHKIFLSSCGKSEFLDAYSRALERSEVPESLPDLPCDQETARVWHRLAAWEHPRVPGIDWTKPV
ncbi:kinase-like domain-containing protein [Suillus occidentalis]|nr:kinase-like domain-containing protein [Suillus occidentalis]